MSPSLSEVAQRAHITSGLVGEFDLELFQDKVAMYNQDHGSKAKAAKLLLELMDEERGDNRSKEDNGGHRTFGNEEIKRIYVNRCAGDALCDYYK